MGELNDIKFKCSDCTSYMKCISHICNNEDSMRCVNYGVLKQTVGVISNGFEILKMKTEYSSDKVGDALALIMKRIRNGD